MLSGLPLYLSLFMAIYLFIITFIEGIKISNSEDKVSGGTFIFSFTMAVIFSGFTYIFN